MSFPAKYALDATKKGSRDAERTRAALLKVAIAHVATAGFHKMTISAVAAEAGVSQSGLLHHFPNKAALLAAVLDERDREDSDFLFGDSDTPLGWDAFDSLVSLVARNNNRPEWVRLFVRIAAEATDPNHPGHDWVTRHYQSMRAWLTDAIHAGVEDGTIRPDIPRPLVVESTIALLDGIQQQWVIDPDTVSMIDNVREHVRVLRQTWSAGM